LGVISADKLRHFIVSLLLTQLSPWMAFLAGVLKELYDEIRGGGADFWDLIADVLGIVLGLWF
jgi:hypothetical protein